jgi:hypothetical protein
MSLNPKNGSTVLQLNINSIMFRENYANTACLFVIRRVAQRQK